jgi:hypothetical protein
MAKKVTKPRTPERIQHDIEDRRGRIRDLEIEIAGLEEEAVAPVRQMAEKLGFRLVRPGRGGRRRTTTVRTSPAGIVTWLKKALKDGPMGKRDLAESFARDGLGARLRLAKYVQEKVVKLDEATDQVALI